MYKFVFVAIVALAALQIQQNDAFIIVSKSVGAAPASSAAPAAPALDPNALIQGLTNAVTAKIQTVTQVVGGLVQAKTNLKQSLLRNVLNTVSSASAALPKPTYITKTIRIPIFVKGGAAPAAPATPAATTAAAPSQPEATTTAAQSAGYAYGYRHRH
ncbi:PREDICTED: uncharacterized protein LOC108967348 [Bactrocera latifrons]|uniref:Uncharacterized protein n=1 Tax=Bactrocera latifrons TaxID=174628 RepID=A0A0K8V0V7_BACLA|nr:PREDICTED: uncharacterized protein LOC108967348 [Bactrocera latifrons]